MIEEGRALFLQIAERVEDSIVDGSLPEESQAPSTNELASFYRINPATAAKGVNMLVDKGVLYKRRGIGMFVSPGARALLRAERRATFADRFVEPMLAEARTLGLGARRPHRTHPRTRREKCRRRGIRHHGRSRPMTPPPDTVIEVSHLTKRYRDTLAVDDVSFSIRKDTIYGLLGRNGAGKTTVMSILTAQNFATSGDVRVFGERPAENARVLQRMCFVRESQKYPDDATPVHAFRTARLFFANWDEEFAQRLIDEFQLPIKKRIKKLSRGQLSAVGVIIGLASRAEITFFDEPYLGLDAVARQIFYDRLLEDYTEHPRTVILSSHLIDEVANLIERVLVIDRGRIIMDEDTDAVRDRAANIVGDTAAVEAFVAGREVIHRESLGRVSSVTVLGAPHARRPRAAHRGRPRGRTRLAAAAHRPHHAAHRGVGAHRGTRRWKGSPMNRTLNVVRMQLVNRQTYVWIPLLILGGASSSRSSIYAMIPTDAPKYGGGAAGAAVVLRRSASRRSR